MANDPAAPAAPEFTVRFKKYEGKKWSTRYHEIDENGVDISEEWKQTKIGTIYVKHDTPVGRASPDVIEVTVKVVE